MLVQQSSWVVPPRNLIWTDLRLDLVCQPVHGQFWSVTPVPGESAGAFA